MNMNIKHGVFSLSPYEFPVIADGEIRRGLFEAGQVMHSGWRIKILIEWIRGILAVSSIY